MINCILEFSLARNKWKGGSRSRPRLCREGKKAWKIF